MEPSNKLLSDIVAFRTYAKHLPHLARRETLSESINRDMTMHLDAFPKLSRDIIKAFQLVHELKIMPSMRALQFAGEAVAKNHCRQYNCSFLPIDDVKAFGETLFLLLSGVGAGYSVQKRHVNELPIIKPPYEEGVFKVHDSIQGWSQALDMLMEAYFFRRIRPVFDYSGIRTKGSYLITTGATAPGPEPLKYMLQAVEEKLKAAIGRKLTPLEVHDIICMISECVLSGGIRRAACICLFDRDDKEMLTCKHGDWHIKHPYRARANNSAILPRSEVTREEFDYIYKMCKDSNSGEPGFSWTNNLDWGFNPCHEISLMPNQFCNLTTINQTGIETKKDYLKRVYSASLIATLQASYTDFPYLRDKWRTTTEKEALIGVSFTGIADNGGKLPIEWLKEGAKLVLDVNEKYAKKIGINIAARATTLKPEGSSSCVLGSSSGIHARHGKHYIRRVRMNNADPLAGYLSQAIPDLVEVDKYGTNGIVVAIPQKSPEGTIIREDETAIKLFDRAMRYNRHWIKSGHRSGDNHNNVSCTISVKDTEWNVLRDKMWEQRDLYSGISLLPYDGGNYEQAPFETIDEQTYEEMSKKITNIDLTKVMESEDNTDRMKQVACVGGLCELDI